MDMMGLAVAIAVIVVVTIILGLIATHGTKRRPGH
ncbi:hypothetical protein SAMN04489740_1356 [Arthrobacter alpinus]|uniref:Uncharacterized protein n=1 Tax=Arthrobacter alpinus TaxID=656366 RepID=A0A1H5IN12_9MICC|nr:hypothetical protein SAMN04489740_1356 [Arthrobacter alpinus]